MSASFACAWGVLFLLRVFALQACDNETVSRLENRLADWSPERRIDAALEIGRQGEVDLAPLLRNALAVEANETVAFAMVRALLSLADGESYEILLGYRRLMDTRLEALEPVARSAPVAMLREAALSEDIQVTAAAIRSLSRRANELAFQEKIEIAGTAGRSLRERGGTTGERTYLASSLATFLRAFSFATWYHSMLALGPIPSEHVPWFASEMITRSLELTGQPDEESVLLQITDVAFPSDDPLARGTMSLAGALLGEDAVRLRPDAAVGPASTAPGKPSGSAEARAWSAACAMLFEWAAATQGGAAPDAEVLLSVMRCPDRRLSEASGIAVAAIAGDGAVGVLIRGLSDPTARTAARAGLLHLGSRALPSLTGAEGEMTEVQRLEAAMLRARIIARTIGGGRR